MLPLALTTGEGEQLWGPMGKTALGGLLVSSLVTLILVPTMYVIISKARQKMSGDQDDARDPSSMKQVEEVAK